MLLAAQSYMCIGSIFGEAGWGKSIHCICIFNAQSPNCFGRGGPDYFRGGGGGACTCMSPMCDLACCSQYSSSSSGIYIL
jgi:hypothetical protein